MKDTPTPHVSVVEASAGSGKTFELARRYIRLLLSPGSHPRSILAITFTNKASVEMKERILDLLKRLALGTFDDPGQKTELLRFLGMTESQAKEASFRALATIIRNYNFFQVQTIDSFINAILSGCAFRLDLAADFRIKSDCSRYISYGLDALIDRAGRDEEVKGLFLDFLHQYMFLENRAGWFPGRDLLGMVTLLFFDSSAYGGPFLRHPVKRGELFGKRKAIVEMMRALRRLEPAGANQTCFKSFRSRLDKYGDSLDIMELSRPFLAEELPMKKGQGAPAEALELWRSIRRQIGEMFEMEALSLFNCYSELFDRVYGEVLGKAADENIMFLPELNSKARLLFENGLTVPELYYRLATRFRHYLIDEFQDTSVLQWKNLYPMLEEALSTGGTLFYVGDTKQAIYRFRGGDASLFHKAERVFAPFGIGKDYLNRNWRSREEIVGFNNSVFSASNLARFLEEREAAEKEKDVPVQFCAADTRDILRIFEEARQSPVSGPGGCVRIEPISPEKGEESDELIRNKLLDLIGDIRERRGSYRDIAVISRANADIEKATAWLIEAGIPVESEKTLNIREHPLVKEIVSFLAFLSSPIDDLAFASFILGDIFTAASGLSRDEIAAFLFKRGVERRKKDTGAYLYRDFRDRYPQAWEKLIEEFFRSIGYTPLYELVVSVYARFDVCARFSEYQGFLMKFLETVREQVSEENSDCAAFLEYFASTAAEDLYVNVSDSEAVKVLSIHKAKGLEFEVVIIPFLEISMESSSGRPYLIDPEDEGGQIRLLRINRGCLPFSALLTRLYSGEYKRQLIDELNTVYVALTRARSELYAFLPEEAGRGANLCRLLIPPELFSRGQGPSGQVRQPPKGSSILLSPSTYANWIPKLREEFMEKSEIQNRERILDGSVMHQALAFIPALTDTPPARAAQEAVARAQKVFPQYKGFRAVEEKLTALLSDPALRDLFYVKDGRVLCEQEICDASGSFWRVDRMIVSPQGIVLIDYKSSRGERQDGISQLAGYRRLAAGAYGLPCRTLLVYLDELKTEETDG